MIPPSMSLSDDISPLTPQPDSNGQSEVRFWKISPGRGGSEWHHFAERHVIAFGEFPTVPDMRELQPNNQRELEAFFREHVLVDSDRSPERAARRMWQFFHEMRPGDSVCAYGDRTILGWGVITSDYFFEQDEFEYAHRRRVRWHTTQAAPADALPEALQTKLKQPITIVPLTEEEFAAVQATFIPDIAAVRRVVERLIPDGAARRQALTLLADAVERVHRIAPDKWSISVYPDHVWLNAGRVAVVDLRQKVWLALDREALLPAPETLLNRLSDGYKSLPASCGLTLELEELGETLPITHRGHEKLIEKAAAAVRVLKADIQGAHRPELLEYLRAELGRQLPDPSYSMHKSAQTPTPNLWWVCQGNSYEQERAGGYMWAPLATDKGHHFGFWDRMDEVRVGDVVIHYANTGVRAFGTVVKESVEARRPSEKGAGTQKGRLVEVEYHPLAHPIPLRSFVTELQSVSIPDGPITQSGASVKQGYLWRFSLEGLRLLRKVSREAWPRQIQDLLGRAPAVVAEVEVAETITATGIEPFLTRLREEQLSFSREVVSNYLLALQTKRFVILSGISGTGKTQLALAVAKQFRKRTSTTVPVSAPSGALQLTVKPSNHKYHRIMVPVALTRNMHLPPTVDEKTSGLIPVSYPGGTTQLRLYLDVRPGSVVAHLLFNAPFRSWFEQVLEVGTDYYLDIEPSDDGSPDGLRFSLPGTATARDELQSTYEVVPVRPDWTDNRGLLGYYNPITGTYRATPALELLLKANAEWEKEGANAHPYFLILDEMNLARVEHYFSDFLSCLESDEPLHLHDDPSVEAGETEDGLAIPRRLRIPPNLFFTGTVNIDETTYMFSPKVLDRAFTLEFNEVDLRGLGAPDNVQGGLSLDQFPGRLQPFGKPSAAHWIKLGAMTANLQGLVIELHDLLQQGNRHFGYRVANEIAAFVTLAAAQTDSDPEAIRAALDLALLQKVLPKFHGTQQELERPLQELLSFTVSGKAGTQQDPDAWHSAGGRLQARPDPASTTVLPLPALPRTGAKVWRMLRRLRAQGFTSFME